MKDKISFLKVLLILVALVWASAAWAAPEDEILKSWTKTEEFVESTGAQIVQMKVTYYSAEYIQALIRSEAQKNLWTRDEEENYKYTLLKTLNLQDNIAFHISFNVKGVPMYPQPFDRHFTLFVAKKKYSPSDYDKRFNFKLSGERDGMLFFPRYDEKTGKDLLAETKDIRLIMSGSISQATVDRGDRTWVWDISRDNPEALGTGKAADRLELDRLLRRMEKLTGERREVQDKIDSIDKELQEVGARVEELQAR
ncbi:MAG: hypothetical protein GX256_04190 [Fretibacterium sp.]|nr:hypothetical protein [Fretibacterium sp.]